MRWHVLEHAAPDEVVIALEADEYPYLQSIIASSEKNGVKMSLIPFYNKYMPSRPSIDKWETCRWSTCVISRWIISATRS